MISAHLVKRLQGNQGAFHLDVKLAIPEGKLVTLYGPSGAGKTSILRMLAGLMSPDDGNINVNETSWFNGNSKSDVPSRKRNVAFVFQDFALFPNMTVVENLCFAMPHRDEKQARDLLTFMDLEGLQDAKPRLLSGGQQQRVALARALAQQPKILLLDEPLSALDFDLRKRMQNLLRKVHDKFGYTTVLVSHDPNEIMALSDWVYHIDNGKIVKEGKVDKFFQNQDDTLITGTVLKIESHDKGYNVALEIQNTSLEIHLSEEKGKTLKVGDKIEMSQNK
ncbi:MAG: ATP-binding cassette domain-containing protein [Bacteroidota bacterium]